MKDYSPMGKSSEKLANSLIIAIITHIYIGWGFLYLIDAAVSHLTHNAYLGIFPALVIILPFFWIAADLARMYPGQKLSVIFSEVFGKSGGITISIIYLCFLIFFLAIAQRDAQLMAHTYFFRRTPFYLITLFFLGGTIYSALQGIKSVGRLAAFMLIPPLIVIFGLEILGLNNLSAMNIQPIFTGSIKQWLGTTLDLPLILLPGTAVFVYLPYFLTGKSILKSGLVSLGIVIPILGLALLGTIGALGPKMIQKMSWPVVEYFHLVDYPYLLLEQAGLFFIIAWYPIHFVATAQGLFVIGNELNASFPQINRKWYTVAIGALIYVMINLPLNLVFLRNFLNKYRAWFTYSYLILLLGTWLIAKLRYNHGRQ
jgi:spore germination protein (amino acid permease)